MISIKDISMGFGEKILLDHIAWNINDGERIGLLGPNGAGKTTLLKIICGIKNSDRGEVIVTHGVKFGYLPQEGVYLSGRTLYKEMEDAFEDVISLFKEKQVLEKRMADERQDTSDINKLLQGYSKIEEELEKKEGYTVTYRIEKILTGLGFSGERWYDRTETFSGGWEMRIALGKILLSEPDVLLLDEPTNYLDTESITWLEKYLSNFKGTMIITSHDRYFMDKMVKRIVEIENGVLTEYNTNFSNYLVEKEKRKEHIIVAYKNQQKQIEKSQRFIERFRAKASHAKGVKSREKQLAKMEKVFIPKESKKVKIVFPSAPHCGRKVIELKDITAGYGGQLVLRGINLKIERGDRIGVVGVNGAGKSTLLKIIAGELKAIEGVRFIGDGVNIGYFGQRALEIMEPENTLLDEMEKSAPNEQEGRLRGILGTFLFTQDDVWKKVKVLSGGETTRLALARILINPVNLLVLDEPTNHLDIYGRKALEDALRAYQGTLIFITHDRYLLDQFAQKIIEVKNGEINLYLGNYSDYIAQKTKEGKKTITVSPKEYQTRKVRTYNKVELNKKCQRLEEKIEGKEKRKKELEALLSKEFLYHKDAKIRNFVNEYKTIEKELKILYNEWENLLESSEKCVDKNK